MNRPTAEELMRLLNLAPLHGEGGYFRETYRSGLTVPAEALPEAFGGSRNASSAIYYFLTPDTVSSIHRLRTDEIFHFYIGDPVEMLLLRPDGTGEVTTLGADIASGMRPQILVPAGVWQGLRLMTGGRYALMGTTMAPGFDPADFEKGDGRALIRQFPVYAEWIRALAHSEE